MRNNTTAPVTLNWLAPVAPDSKEVVERLLTVQPGEVGEIDVEVLARQRKTHFWTRRLFTSGELEVVE